MSGAVKWDPEDSVGKLALEVARIASEGLGVTTFQQIRAGFNQQVEQASDDPDVQIRSVIRLLIALTRKDDTRVMTTAEVQRAGFCLMWLAETRVAEWSLLRLYQWGESLPLPE